MREFNIEEELAKVPHSPGVYLMHDESDEIIYVGKARILSHRLHQYFQDSHSEGIRKDIMVSRIAYFEYIVTDTEVEALVLECNLIKQHKPKYNTLLTDDKTYPFIKVTVNEKFPRVLFTREMKHDGSAYFGPYISALAIKDTINLLQKLYHVRNCSNMPMDGRECLYYHIGMCEAPCTGKQTPEDYSAKIKGVLEFLNGKFEPVLKDLNEKMLAASENLEFEAAAEYRDLYRSVASLQEKQKITKSDGSDRDIIAIAREGNEAVVQIFFIRDGRMTGRDHFYIKPSELDESPQVYASFIKLFYSGTPVIPSEVMIHSPAGDMEALEEFLSAKRGRSVHIMIPKKGEKSAMTNLAFKNAHMVLKQDRERLRLQEMRTTGAMREIASLIGTEELFRMEAYDISNISGVYPVGSMVVFEGGRPKKSDYRRFNIKTVQGQDDYASLKEVLTRRFTHKGGGFDRFPDVIMMDGGRGQVNVCLEVLSELGLDIPVCGMVKDDTHSTRGLYHDNRLLPMDTHSEAFKLITRLQDEAHRFAIEFHRSLRGKGQVRSVLDDVPGIGPKRRKALLLAFGDIDAIKAADEESLAAADGMDRKSARSVYEFFHAPQSEENGEGSQSDR
ncbi:MAG: excinuclease ABC subunit UvrC [Lachnospiraceae bacterium]|nr:excinuclease ABC subunit UvrC [Lachnospiraceae bacterium]